MNRRFSRPALVVVKIGSSSLRRDDGRLDRDQVQSLAHQVLAARADGSDVVIVSSGAVAAGMGLLGLDRRPVDLPTLQAAAAVGQGELIQAYQQVLEPSGHPAAQILLSQDDFVRRGRYLNARTTIRRLIELGAVPIINENDAIATDELTYGDNDHLAALVASMLDADLLVLLSDVDALHTADPRTDTTAQAITQVEDPAELDGASIGGVGSYVGSGGMRTKVQAAEIAMRSACHAVIAHARQEEILADVVRGQPIGTWFVAQPRRLDSRRLWIGFALNTHGRVHIDQGAAEALRTNHRSLLAVGVTRAEGDFGPGDAVEVVDPAGRVIARGLVNYDAADLTKIAGRTTADASEHHGPGYTREVIHRDDLVIVG